MSTEPVLLQLVVIGSSAGGIEALSTLVATLPPTFPAPLIVAQHLDPTRPSHLEAILARRTSLPVVTVTDQTPLQAGTIYVVPPNHHVEITDHDLTALPHIAGRPKPSIDLLLMSAAAVYGEQLIAVILTGTGSDGTRGAWAVHTTGGTVVIQNPRTAAYPGMPESLAPDTVDIVADLPRIGPILGDLLAGIPVPPQPDAAPELDRLLDQVQAQRGIDFRAYKPATILRRLQRRLSATASADLAGYRAYLTAHPEEYDHLVRTCLIKVTEFLRDPELFAALRTQILPELVATSRERHQELRLWSAGCATGEEAYSLAILVCEVLGEDLARFDVRIFATDLDADAVAFARRGIYPKRAVRGLPADLLVRYFTAGPDGYAIHKQVRALVIFGEHDLGQRAPFPRIDLVLCRNVLIYFSKELQQRALQLFAFALREGGYLVLGRAETVSPLAEFFVPALPAHKVSRRQGTRRPVPVLSSVPAPPLAGGRSAPRLPSVTARELVLLQQETQQARAVRDTLLLQLPLGVVVVDRHYDIVEINPAARRLLSIHSSAIGEDLVHLAQHLPPRLLRSAIDRTFQEEIMIALEEVTVPHVTTGEATQLQLTCYPQAGVGPGGAVVLILVSDVTPAVADRWALAQAQAAQVTQEAERAQAVAELRTTHAALAQRTGDLEAAEAAVAHHTQQMDYLVATNHALLAANEALTRTNAELRAASDSYLLTNEEAQAAIEEAETLNEEMQATNEELETLNEEMQATVEELHTSNTELAARGEELQQFAVSLERAHQHSEHERAQLATILASLADAVLVVTPDGTPLVTNTAYTLLLDGATGELADDRGVVLSPEATPQARAARGETFALTFTWMQTGGERRWYEAIGAPLRTDEVLQGGVVVIRDITERSLRHLQEEFLGLASHELRTPLTTISATLQLLARWHRNRAESERPVHQIEAARTQVARLGRLIDDLLDVSRLQTGKFSLHLAPVRLDTLLAQTVEVGQTLTTTQRLTLAADPAPLVIEGDADRLQQVVLNLLTNAMTHAATSPQITVALRSVGRWAEITVQDTGPGIAPDDLPHLFTRFYQVPRAGATPSGLGLGLYICQQIVTAHGGTITVRSTLEEGTTFTVALPLTAPTAAVVPA